MAAVAGRAAALGLLLLCALAAAASASPPVSVLSFGAVPHNSSAAAARANAQALRKAVQHVAALAPPRVVVVPSTLVFSAYNVTLSGMRHTELRIEGEWRLQDDHAGWPRTDPADPSSERTNLIDVRHWRQWRWGERGVVEEREGGKGEKGEREKRKTSEEDSSPPSLLLLFSALRPARRTAHTATDLRLKQRLHHGRRRHPRPRCEHNPPVSPCCRAPLRPRIARSRPRRPHSTHAAPFHPRHPRPLCRLLVVGGDAVGEKGRPEPPGPHQH